ncbi:MAG: OmpH family outer membrane protein [Alphaproteobacteria bacterium]|jgi:Skp family chaperone for outer membrane proteins|nr:OmpH family outer membrane protein [Alphaproteobacteria bacterium]
MMTFNISTSALARASNRKRALARLVLFAMLGVSLLGGVAYAATPVAKPAVPAALKPTYVAIVDVQRILQASKAAKSARDQLEAQRSKFQSEISSEEADLREAEKKLIKLREEAKADAYAEEEQKLQKRFLTVERHVQSRRKALDQAFTDSMNTVRTGLVDIVSQVAKEKGFSLVVVKQQVIWNADAVDITDEVLMRLDKALPQISVKVLADEMIQDDGRHLLKPRLNQGP